MDKTHPLLMGMTMDVTYIWSHALVVELDFPLANGNNDGCFIHLESCTGVWLGKTPLANHNEKGLLQHLESYTGVLLGKTPPLLMKMTKDVL